MDLLQTMVSADPLDARGVSVVVAHPDDETICCGALLGRLEGVRVIMATDGAPRDLADAHVLGLAEAQAYAAARRRELEAALALAGVARRQITCLALADQTAARQLVPLSRNLTELFARFGVHTVLTHAYEGGHPDHDAVAFAVHAAAQGRQVIEMPYYRADGDGMAVQSFALPETSREIRLALRAGDEARKAQMIAAHASQARTLAAFDPGIECFRPAPAYDFRGLPNGGALLYERRPWGLRGAEWMNLAAAALAELREC